MKTMKHVMIDIETLGTSPGAVILSIGAVIFELNGNVGEKWYAPLDIKKQLDIGMKIEADTLLWWERQPQDVRDRAYMGNPLPLQTVLNEFKIWFESNGLVYPWGNSARFDMGLLEALFIQLNIQVPWMHWNERCCRTIAMLCPAVKGSMPKPSNAHDPITDCQYQIAYVAETLKAIQWK